MYTPLPKQRLAHSSPADLTLYGGSVGGGKSDFLIHEGHQTLLDIEAAGLEDQVLMLRRTFPELQENMDRAQTVIDGFADWQSSNQRWVYPNNSVLRFTHMQFDKDVTQHKSFEYCLIEFDELTSFTEFQFRYLLTRNRTSNPGVRARVVAATNPGDVGHFWVKRWFISIPEHEIGNILYVFPVRDLELLWQDAMRSCPPSTLEHLGETLAWYEERASAEGLDWFRPTERDRKRLADPEERERLGMLIVWEPQMSRAMLERNRERELYGLAPIRPRSRTFVPSKLLDNPYLSFDPTYESGLYGEQEASTIVSLVDGNWDIFEGQVFKEFRATKRVLIRPEDGGEPYTEELPWHVISPILPGYHWVCWRSIDWGFDEPLCCLWWTINPETRQMIVYRELYQAELTDEEAIDQILALTGEGERIYFSGVDPISFWTRKSENKRQLNEIWRELGLPVIKSENNRIAGKRRIHSLLAEDLERRLPKLAFTEDCRNLIRTLPELVYNKDKGNPEDVDDRSEDHAYDALRYGAMIAPAAHGRKVKGARANQLLVGGLPGSGGRAGTRFKQTAGRKALIARGT